MKEDNQPSGLTDDEQKLFEEILSEDVSGLTPLGESRRHFLKIMTAAGAGALALQMLGGSQALAETLNDVPPAFLENALKVSFTVNGAKNLLK